MTTSPWAKTLRLHVSRDMWWQEGTALSQGPAPTMAPGVAPCQCAKVSTTHRSDLLTDTASRAGGSQSTLITIRMHCNNLGTPAHCHVQYKVHAYTLRSNVISKQGDTVLPMWPAVSYCSLQCADNKLKRYIRLDICETLTCAYKDAYSDSCRLAHKSILAGL